MVNNFHVGQKVAATTDLECGISKGDVVTISSIKTGEFVAYDGLKQSISLFFEELKPRSGFSGFDPRFFRPVVTRKTDISIFTAMLHTQRTGVDA